MMLAYGISWPHAVRPSIPLFRCMLEPLYDDTTEKSKGRGGGLYRQPVETLFQKVMYDSMGEVPPHDGGNRMIDGGS